VINERIEGICNGWIKKDPNIYRNSLSGELKEYWDKRYAEVMAEKRKKEEEKKKEKEKAERKRKRRIRQKYDKLKSHGFLDASTGYRFKKHFKVPNIEVYLVYYEYTKKNIFRDPGGITSAQLRTSAIPMKGSQDLLEHIYGGSTIKGGIFTPMDTLEKHQWIHIIDNSKKRVWAVVSEYHIRVEESQRLVTMAAIAADDGRGNLDVFKQWKLPLYRNLYELAKIMKKPYIMEYQLVEPLSVNDIKGEVEKGRSYHFAALEAQKTGFSFEEARNEVIRLLTSEVTWIPVEKKIIPVCSRCGSLCIFDTKTGSGFCPTCNIHLHIYERNEGEIICDKCGAIIPSESKIVDYSRVDSLSFIRHICPMCWKETDYMESIAAKRRWNALIKAGELEPLYICTICGSLCLNGETCPVCDDTKIDTTQASLDEEKDMDEDENSAKCPDCGTPLIAQQGSWFCPKHNVYLCRSCGKPLRYIAEYQRWYCDYEKNYP